MAAPKSASASPTVKSDGEGGYVLGVTVGKAFVPAVAVPANIVAHYVEQAESGVGGTGGGYGEGGGE